MSVTTFLNTLLLAYQLLQDLTFGTTLESLYSEEEIQQRYSEMMICFLELNCIRLSTTIDSLKQWKSNEYVTAAAFEYLAALYFKCIKHDFRGT